MSKDVEKTEYGTGTWDTPPSDEDYTLEEILAEYGSSRPAENHGRGGA